MKKILGNYNRQNQGITLIALIITIIILIILAGVSISLIGGPEGIIAKAQEAKEKTRGSQIKEAVDLTITNNELEKLTGGTEKSKEQLIEELSEKDQLTPEEVEILENTDIITIGDIEIDFSKLNSILDVLKVGDIIKYSPSGTYEWNAEYATSYDELSEEYAAANKTISSAEGENFAVNSWVVLDIDLETEKIKIVPKTLASGTVTLHGIQGFNNGVKLLNDACSSLYSDSSKGVTARNLNRDDLEKLAMDKLGVSLVENRYTGYGSVEPGHERDWPGEAPTIFFSGNNWTVNGVQNTNGIGDSEQTQFIERVNSITRIENDDEKKAIQTAYSVHTLDSLLGVYYEIIIKRNAWLSTRCVDNFSFQCYEMCRLSYDGNITTSLMDQALFNDAGNAHSLYPIVTLNPGNIAKNESGEFIVR